MYSFVNTVPASVGEKLSQVDTPSLILYRKALHRNLQKMKDFVDKHNSESSNKLMYRPHTKTHKCPALAKLQIEEYGANGVCVQILDEAEAMINAGVTDVFISNQCIGAKKIARLCDLASRGKVSVIVDNMENLQQISQAASVSGVTLDVLVEINAGQNRCGVDVLVDNGKTCVELAKAVIASPQLNFKGIHCYHGGIQHTRSKEERRQQVMDMPVRRARIGLGALNEAGISVEVVTGGGTGTYPYESYSGIYTEIQPGSYCMMDVDYGDNEDGQSLFENALFLHAMIISKTVGKSEPTRAVLDAGTKASSYDSGMPIPLSGWVDGHLSKRLSRNYDLILQNGGDEHSVLIGEYCNSLNVGETMRLIPGHVDPTVNMHQYLVVVDDNPNVEDEEPVVVDIWSVSGRSAGF